MRQPTSVETPRQRGAVIELAPELVSDLRREAIRRHVSVSSLAVRLLDTAVRDGLVDAILDDDVPEPV